MYSSGSTDALALIETWIWRLRVVVSIGVYAIVFSRHGSDALRYCEVALSAVAVVGWYVAERRDTPRARTGLTGCLMVLGALGTIGAANGRVGSVIAFTIMAMIAAGMELDGIGLLWVGTVGVLGTEVAAIVYHHTDLGTVFGYPAVVAGTALLGRYRRAYRIQADQAKELLAQTQRAQDEAERAAALTERSRIAREIHDVLAHSLGALGIQLQATEVLLSDRGDIDGALGALAGARKLVDEGLTETRRAVHALRTDAPPLPQSLAALVGDGALTVVGAPYPLSPAAGLALLRVAQEAVTNAAKHADGHPPSIRLDYGDAEIRLRIENALGSDSSPRETAGGYGLAGMHERLKLIGGELNAGPAGRRWVVDARVTR